MLIYLDANFFINAVEGEGVVADLCGEILEAGRGHQGLLCTSELTLAEVLVGPLKSRKLPSPEDLWGGEPGGAKPSTASRLWLNAGPIASAYGELIQEGGELSVLPVNRSILVLAAHWRAEKRGIKLPDAIHLATAEKAGCTHLISGDHPVLRVSAPFAGMSLDQSGLRGLVAEISRLP